MVSMKTIRTAVAEAMNINTDVFETRRRDKQAYKARQLAWWLARELTQHSFPTIANYIGRVDHTTVMHGIKRHEARMIDEPDLKVLTEELAANLKASDDQTSDLPNAAAQALPAYPDRPTKVRVGDFVEACRSAGKRVELVDISDPPYSQLLGFWQDHHGAAQGDRGRGALDIGAVVEMSEKRDEHE